MSSKKALLVPVAVLLVAASTPYVGGGSTAAAFAGTPAHASGQSRSAADAGRATGARTRRSSHPDAVKPPVPRGYVLSGGTAKRASAIEPRYRASGGHHRHGGQSRHHVPAVPRSGVDATPNAAENPDGTYSETAGSVAHTWTNYTNAGGSQGPSVGDGQTIEIACVVQGFRVQDGNTNWYQIAQSPWSYNYYVSADAFYNNGQTSGTLKGTPFVDPSVPACGQGGVAETAGSAANTWTNYSNAGGTQGPTIGGGATVHMSCKVQGFKVQDGNVWWYRIQDGPWNNQYYVSADAFYNNGQTSGSLLGTPFVDNNVPDCATAPPPAPTDGGVNETTGSTANTWTDYTDAGGSQGQTIASHATVSIACKIQGFRVADGNTWWYRIAQDPWNGQFYVSADAFYNNGQTSGSLVGTPFYDPAVPDCTTTPSPPSGGANETAGSVAHTWTDYSDAGGTEGPNVGNGQTILIACKLSGFRVADGNTWWYQIAASPWNGSYYVSADAFYNDGQTSGSLLGTPFVDSSVPDCANQNGGGGGGGSGHPSGETTGGPSDTFGNYSHAGAPGPNRIPSGDTVQITCRAQGFRVADGNTWWYLVASAPWNNIYYVSADAFYNNGQTSGSLIGTPFYDPAVPVCVNNTETPLYSSSSYGSSQSTTNRTSCPAGDPVNCASGNFSQSFTDIALPGRGPDVSLVRTYNSLNPTTEGIFGFGWTSTYDQQLDTASPTRASDGSIVVTLDDGSQIAATPNDSGGYSTPTSTDSTFVQNADGSYTLTRHSTSIETFNPAGQLISLADLNGNTTTLGYDSNDHLSTITDAAGRIVNVTTNSSGLVTAVTDPLGRTTTYTYDGNGNLISTSDPVGRTWTFNYDGNHRMTTMTDPRGGVVTNTFDTVGRVIQQTDPAGLSTTFAYTGDNFGSTGGTTTITDPHGNVRVEQYADGFLTQVTRGFGTSEQATSSYVYDPTSYGLIQSTDPDGHVTTYTYDEHGRRLSTTDPLGHVTSTSYNDLGEVLTSTTPLGEVTTNTYDSNGNLLTTTDPDGNTTTYHHDDPSHPADVTSVTDPDGRVVTYTYDTNGDLASSSVSPANGQTDTTDYSYDADGEPVCEASANATAGGLSCPAPGATPPAGTTDVAYDNDGEVVSTTDPDANTTTTQYDADGDRTSVTDPDGHVTATTYDADRRVTSVTTGAGGSHPVTTSTNYDVLSGNGACPGGSSAVYCTVVTNGNGNHTVQVYGPRDEQVEEILPGGQQTSFAYDLAGNKITQTDQAGRVTSYTYDAANRLTATTYSDGTTPNVSYGYDADGHRTTMTDGTGTTTISYDPDGRVTSTTNGAGAQVSYHYDGHGDITDLGYPNGKSISRSYNGADQLSSITDWLGKTTTFSYDPDGNLAHTGYPNGDTVTTTYDGDDNLTATHVTNKTGTTLVGLTDTRERDELISKEADTGSLTGTTAYTYNDKNQLSAAGSTNYAYDSDGNPITNGSTSQTFNAADQITKSTTGTATTAYHYDADGDRSRTVPQSGASTTYTYDQANRLIAAAKTTPAVPTITAVSPAAGLPAGGTSVTISGTGFSDASKVVFGSVAATNYAVDSDTQITATSPPESAGKKNIVITTPGGHSATVAADAFTYKTPLPAIITVSPTVGLPAGGTTVTITGTAFTGATKVLFGSVAATGFTVNSDTQITAVSPAQKAGTKAISVTTPGGKSAATPADVFTYTTTAPDLQAVPNTARTDQRAAARARVKPQAALATPGVTLLANYTYNGDGLRMTETSSSATVSYAWDTTTSIPQMLTDGTNSYLYGPGGLPIEHINTAGTPTYYFHDALGTTRALLTSTGTVGATYTYSPYGALTKKTGSSTTPLMYGQSDSDPASGLDYLINRHYDPSTGQFMTIDPDFATTASAYGYAADDPTGYIDPNGLLFKLPSWVNPAHDLLSLAKGGYDALNGEATAIATCQFYGWASNACSDATWDATLGVLTFGVETYSPEANTVITYAGYAQRAVSTAADLYYGSGTGTADGGTSHGTGCNPVSQSSYGAGAILQPANVQLQ